ncbi:hypothetical protein ACIRD6_31830, partial [Streptomyces sp. NPDC102473]|uniref:hypothetical protein n=1 Tax=Streptomyces sp. NPDC102473 TaxID=3366180 RepID=UPI00382B4CFE
MWSARAHAVDETPRQIDAFVECGGRLPEFHEEFAHSGTGRLSRVIDVLVERSGTASCSGSTFTSVNSGFTRRANAVRQGPARRRGSRTTPSADIATKSCCRTSGIGHSSCMGGVLRAEPLWVETFTG